MTTLNKEQNIERKAFEFIAEFEGFKGSQYHCAAGVTTVGHGLTNYWTNANNITETESERIAKHVIHTYYETIKKYVHVDLTDNQMVAMISMAYNVGITAFINSTVVTKLNAGKFNEVEAAMNMWVKVRSGGTIVTSQGLVNRRKAEYAQFCKQDTNSKLLRVCKK